MPVGLQNAPAIQQRRVTAALREYIGVICHVYLDDIVIWSENIEEHHENVRKILEALRAAHMFVNMKKSHLYQTSIDFLGHRISANGIEADYKKVDRILAWPTPTSAKEVRAFLGLVRYIAVFLPNLAEHTRILHALTTQESEMEFPVWTKKHQSAFEVVKTLVVGRDCLTTIDHKDTSKTIFVTTDASDFRSGGVLSFGQSWETAWPVAFESQTFKGAELNYSVHEKKLLAIVRALKKWHADLFGTKFVVFTDHKTLLNFERQRDLSRRQARWMEFLSQFDCKMVYVKGEDNSVADALSRLPYDLPDSGQAIEASCTLLETMSDDDLISQMIGAVFPSSKDSPFEAAFVLAHAASDRVAVCATTPHLLISMDESFVNQLKEGYKMDPWCQKLTSAARGMNSLINRDGLWFCGSRLLIPRVGDIRERIF